MKAKYTLLIVWMSIALVDCSHKEVKPFSIISYNVWNGFEGEEQRQAQFVEWAKQQDVDVIAFQELNGYTQDSLYIRYKEKKFFSCLSSATKASLLNSQYSYHCNFEMSAFE